MLEFPFYKNLTYIQTLQVSWILSLFAAKICADSWQTNRRNNFYGNIHRNKSTTFASETHALLRKLHFRAQILKWVWLHFQEFWIILFSYSNLQNHCNLLIVNKCNWKCRFEWTFDINKFHNNYFFI